MKRGQLPTTLLLIGLSTLVWFPLVFLVGGSFMGAAEITENLAPVLSNRNVLAEWTLIPLYPTIKPYVELLLDSPQFFVMFWNSVKLSVAILLGQMLVGVPAAWGFAQYEFRGKNLLFTGYIVLMLMPFQVTMVSSYVVLDQLKLLDTHAGIILPMVFSTFPVFIIYRFFRAVPKAIIESAALEGAGDIRILLHIGIPLGASGILSAVVLGFLECWNLIEQPLTFLRTQSLWPLSLYLPSIVDGKPELALAASVVVLIPALLVFLCGQSYLEQGIIAASVKE